MIAHIKKNLVEAPVHVIIHSAKCFNTFGSGVALAIKNKFPEAYLTDLRSTKGDRAKLGSWTLAEIANPTMVHWVINLYGQYNYGRDKRYTDYEALAKGLESISKSLVLNLKVDQKCPVIGFPYKMGCGTGGGRWAIVQAMIEEYFKDYPSDVLICEY